MKINKLASLILKIVVIISAIVGTFLSAYAGRNSFMGGAFVFLYFTIQSNILVALICLLDIIFTLTNKINNRIWSVIKLVGTVSITLTGVVFCVVLAPTMGKNAFNTQNILTHVIVPIGVIVDLYLGYKDTNLVKKDVIYTVIPPILYAIFASIGYITKLEFAKNTYYPYFFLNWGSKAGAIGFSNELPFMGPVYWIILLCGFIIGVGFIYITTINKIKKKNN